MRLHPLYGTITPTWRTPAVHQS